MAGAAGNFFLRAISGRVKYERPMGVSKRITGDCFVALAMTVVVVFLLITLVCHSSISSADFQPTFKGHEKIGLALVHKWRQAMAEGDLGQEVPCMVRLTGKADDESVAALKNAGLKVGAVLKTIVTGRIKIGDLPLLVALDEVREIGGGERVMLK